MKWQWPNGVRFKWGYPILLPVSTLQPNACASLLFIIDMQHSTQQFIESTLLKAQKIRKNPAWLNESFDSCMKNKIYVRTYIF